MKLIERYALQCGLKIGNQFLYEKFFPVGHDGPYITVQGGSGMPGKNYPYFNEVFDVIAPLLAKYNVKLIQIGGPEDQPISNCLQFQGKTDIHQTNYILKRALMHIGNDSWMMHRCGYLGIPVVEVFGTTSTENHSPYIYNSKSIFLESHRWNKNPSFQLQEFPQTIALIPPEDVINAMLKILGASASIGLKSYFFGMVYQQNVVEWVPNFLISPDIFKGQPLIARLDYANALENEQMLVNCLQIRPFNIVTNRPIDLNWVRGLKKNIIGINYEVTEKDTPDYIKELKKVGIKIRFFSRETDKDKLSTLRTKFLDVTLIEKFDKKGKDNFFEESAKYLNKPVDKDESILQNLSYRSKKYILSEGKIHLSKAALAAKLHTDKFENNVSPIIDSPDFWEEIDHFYIFKQK